MNKPMDQNTMNQMMGMMQNFNNMGRPGVNQQQPQQQQQQQRKQQQQSLTKADFEQTQAKQQQRLAEKELTILIVFFTSNFIDSFRQNVDI